jgi:hypothetical protein
MQEPAPKFSTIDPKISFRKISLRGDIPSARISAVAAILGKEKKLLLLGGNTSDDELSDLHELDLASGTWKKKYTNFQTKWTGQAGVSICSGSGQKAALVTYGGFLGHDYSDSLYLLECASYNLIEAKKHIQKMAANTAGTFTPKKI